MVDCVGLLDLWTVGRLVYAIRGDLSNNVTKYCVLETLFVKTERRRFK
mgnify:CR=1 FL=1